MRTKLLQTFVLGVAFGIASCGGSTDNGSHSTVVATGGATSVSQAGGNGPVQSGGSSGSTFTPGGNTGHPTGGTVANESGGTSNAVNPTTSLGGTQATGGSSSGNTGSNSTGGTATGGKSASGGAAMGGATTGGKSATGGTAMGGATTGGKSATGGVAMGGAATGGKSASGGAATGGKSAAGGTAAGGAGTGGAATGGASTASTTTSDPCSTAATLSGAIRHCNQNNSGSYGNFEWQLWSAQTTGCLTTYSGAGGAFSANWDNSGDFLARVGLVFDGTQTYQQLGVFSADFAETKTGGAGGYSYIGVYGRTETPNVEFYIIEDSFDASPAILSAVSTLGTIQVDGGTYDVDVSEMTGTGPTTTRLYSVQQTSRHCGHISISEHFAKWTSLGMQLGKMVEVSIAVEAGGGTGSIDFTTASVTGN